MLFDITFYGNNLFQSTVLRAVFGVEKADTNKPTPLTGDLKNNLCLQMTVVAAIALPGYYLAVYLMDSMGRRMMQLQGFFFMAVTFGILGVFDTWPNGGMEENAATLMLIIYGLTFFFSNFGPNSTTFILPAETFHGDVRSSLNGFSAAMGKVGATIGSATFKPMKEEIGLSATMGVCAAVSLCGFFLTWFFIEDRRGQEMEGDEQFDEEDKTANLLDEEEKMVDPLDAAFENQRNQDNQKGYDPLDADFQKCRQ